MKLHWLKQYSDSKRLLLIFSGWSVDWHLFTGYTYPAKYDVAVVWDYADLSTGIFAHMRNYDETIVIAWSFGVACFDRVFQDLPDGLNINCTIAVNGTTHPVDDTLGIPKDIFAATLSGLSEDSLSSFQRRICGGGARFREFKTVLQEGADDIDSLKRQLETFQPSNEAVARQNGDIWDRAFISERDMIFPAVNMMRAWENKPTAITCITGCHLPDFQYLISTCIRDKALIEQQFSASLNTYDENAEVQTKAARHLTDIWNITSSTTDILEIGPGSGTLSREITRRIPEARLTWIDLTNIAPEGCEGRFIHGDAETEIRQLPNESFDAIISANSVQWFHSPLRFLQQAYRVLRKGGSIVLSTFGPGNLKELDSANGGISLPYLSCDDWRHIASAAGLEIERIESETMTIEFNSGRDMINHLKKTGVNALTHTSGHNRYAALKALMNSGNCRLTFTPLYLVLKK